MEEELLKLSDFQAHLVINLRTRLCELRFMIQVLEDLGADGVADRAEEFHRVLLEQLKRTVERLAEDHDLIRNATRG